MLLPISLTGERYTIPSVWFDSVIINFQSTRKSTFFFQQDGAPPHYALHVRAKLDETFPNRFIERKGPIEASARSPDLIVLDYFCVVAWKVNYALTGLIIWKI